MRDLVDCCPEATADCGNDQKAKAVGCDVYVGNNLIQRFDERSDDYAYTNAQKFADQWNKHNAKALGE